MNRLLQWFRPLSLARLLPVPDRYPSAAPKRPPRYHPELQSLEDRLVLSLSRPAVINYPSYGPSQNAFVTRDDGNLYYTWFDGGSWQNWVNLGHPAGAGLYGDPAVINYPNADGPYQNAFVTGNDGNLYYTWFDGGSWQNWVNLGHPAGTAVSSDPAVINYPSDGPYENAFVTGDDGNLYYRWFDGSSWQGWVNLGHPGLGPDASMNSDSRPGPSEKVISLQPLPQNQELPSSPADAVGPHRVTPPVTRRQPLKDFVLAVQDSEWQLLEPLRWLPAAEVDLLAGLVNTL